MHPPQAHFALQIWPLLSRTSNITFLLLTLSHGHGAQLCAAQEKPCLLTAQFHPPPDLAFLLHQPTTPLLLTANIEHTTKLLDQFTKTNAKCVQKENNQTLPPTITRTVPAQSP